MVPASGNPVRAKADRQRKPPVAFRILHRSLLTHLDGRGGRCEVEDVVAQAEDVFGGVGREGGDVVAGDGVAGDCELVGATRGNGLFLYVRAEPCLIAALILDVVYCGPP